jgi:dihydrofolate reductase
MSKIKSIFAIDKFGGIGKNESLPWPHDKEDMNWFIKNTKNQIVLMGSKTWQSKNMLIPLPNRINVVVTSKHIEDFPKSDYVISADEINWGFDLIMQDYPDKDIWIIGGAKTLNSTKHLVQEAYITYFNDHYDCDVNLDIIEYLKGFSLTKEIYSNNKTFRVYKK